MKGKLLSLAVLFFLAGCSLIWSPTVTVKAYLAAAQKGDVDTMTKLFSSRAIEETGLDKVRSSKQGSSWKIDEIGGTEKEATGNLDQPAPGEVLRESVPPPPPLPEKDQNQNPSPGISPTKRAPISGGVLNGKAISLPQPAYPPIAKAAHASGTVVVQVLVDENGNVIDAHAVSGHPLLQAASVSAARSAKFSPTKLSGQPVKVTGVITYKFVAQ
jgi:protein TonB